MIQDHDFPPNPLLPSLTYAAVQQLPISIPWSGAVIDLGASFETTHGSDDPKFKDGSAFVTTIDEKSRPFYRESRGGNYVEATTLSNGISTEHMSLSIAASIGGSFLGASGRGTYETNAFSNRDAAKASVRSSLTNGVVYLAEEPRLSATALEILRAQTADSEDPEKVFRKRFGNYYVTSVVVGASNATLVAASSSKSSESKDMAADVTVKFLGFKKTKHFEDHKVKQSYAGTVSLNGYDSLANDKLVETGSGQVAFPPLQKKAEENLNKSRRVGVRIGEVVRRLGLSDGVHLSRSQYTGLFEQHLVVDLVLKPFAHHRGYQQARLSWGEV